MMCKANAGRCHVDRAEDNGQVKPARPRGAGVEDGNVTVASDEGHVRVAAHDEGCRACVREAGGIGAQLRPVDRDVQQQDAQQRRVTGDDFERQHVGQVRTSGVDVASHGEKRSNALERIEDVQVPDIPGMQDGIRAERREMTCGRRVKRGVRVCNDTQAQRAVGMRRDACMPFARLGSGHAPSLAGQRARS